MSVIDLGAARWKAAGADCSKVTMRDALAEAVRQLDTGEWAADSVIIIGMETTEDGATQLQILHGGPASTNERIGMYARAPDLSLRNMNGDLDG